MRPHAFTRSNAKVFLSLLYSALCQFVRRFKWSLMLCRSELPYLCSDGVMWLSRFEPSRDFFLLLWRTLRLLLPSGRTILLYLLTFIVFLPFAAMHYNNTLYQELLIHKTAVSPIIKQIVAGPNMSQQVVEENTERLRRSIHVLDRLTIDYHNITAEIRSRSFKDVMIGIVTYSRDKYRDESDRDPRQYLTQLVASIIDKYKKYREVKLAKPIVAPFHERSLSIGLVVCDVDEEPDKHQEFRWLVNRVKLGNISRKNSVKYMNSCEDPERKVTGMGPWGPFEYKSKFEKQKEDYTFCLRFFQDYGLSRYVLALEDDVLPSQDFFFKLHELVINRLDRYEHGSDLAVRRHDNYFGRPPVFMVKLHHPEVFLSYHNLQRERLPQLFAMATISSIILIVVSRFLPLLRPGAFARQKPSKPTSPEPANGATAKMNSQTVPELTGWNTVVASTRTRHSRCFMIMEQLFGNFDWFLFTKWFIYFSLVFLMIGRENTYKPLLTALHSTFGSVPNHFITLVSSPSCCMTAVLYPKQSVTEVIDYFEQNRCIFSQEARDDMLFGHFSEKLPGNMISLMTEPNLFQHIGRYSSIRGRVNQNDDREWVGTPF